LISTPRRAAEPSALTMVTGVEITSAQGQPITSSTSALYSACVQVAPASSGSSTAVPMASAKIAGV
jgi:hypothetical protein